MDGQGRRVFVEEQLELGCMYVTFRERYPEKGDLTQHRKRGVIPGTGWLSDQDRVDARISRDARISMDTETLNLFPDDSDPECASADLECMLCNKALPEACEMCLTTHMHGSNTIVCVGCKGALEGFETIRKCQHVFGPAYRWERLEIAKLLDARRDELPLGVHHAIEFVLELLREPSQ